MLVWAILGSFLSLFVSLPMSHDCSDEVALGWQGATAHAAANSVANQDKDQTPPQKPEVCQACLWSQALHESRVSAGPALDHEVSPPPLYVQVFLNLTSDFFPAASKRGPPPQWIL